MRLELAGYTIDGKKIDIGDVLVALPSGGLQTNGYSLVRKIWTKRERMFAKTIRIFAYK